MDANQLYQLLKKTQEAQGYFFNQDREFTLELLESLLENRKRYGYMACPCRLAAGEFAADRDIVCPCDYREPDVREYGRCYCGLYVDSQAEVAAGREDEIPDRRPPELVQ